VIGHCFHGERKERRKNLSFFLDIYKNSATLLSMEITKQEFKQDLNLAIELGSAAYKNGISAATACDMKFQPLVVKYSNDFVRLMKLMDAWNKAYFTNLHAEV
jgi:hypothetical protein